MSGINTLHIADKQNLLEKWSGRKIGKVVFDSDIDGDSNRVFSCRIKNKEHLYFLCFDNQQNIFGGYFDDKITTLKEWNFSENQFLFTFNKFGKHNAVDEHLCQKYEQIGRKGIFIHQDDNDRLFNFYCGFSIGKINENVSNCIAVSVYYQNCKNKMLNGMNSWQTFPITRLLVLTMC